MEYRGLCMDIDGLLMDSVSTALFLLLTPRIYITNPYKGFPWLYDLSWTVEYQCFSAPLLPQHSYLSAHLPVVRQTTVNLTCEPGYTVSGETAVQKLTCIRFSVWEPAAIKPCVRTSFIVTLIILCDVILHTHGHSLVSSIFLRMQSWMYKVPVLQIRSCYPVEYTSTVLPLRHWSHHWHCI